MPKYVKILQEDLPAPDARELFMSSSKITEETGLTLSEFFEKAEKSPDDGYTEHWYLDDYRMSISADFQYYTLYKSVQVSPIIKAELDGIVPNCPDKLLKNFTGRDNFDIIKAKFK